jgi:coniferyl-aldehyde dehydrogenase
VRDLLEAQRRAFATSPPRYAQRVDALRALEESLSKRRHDIAAAIAEDFGGRPAEETFALELFPLLNEIRHACRNLKSWMKPRRAPVQWQFQPATARILYQPLGVVGILSPWNYPFFLTLAPLTGVLAAGNHALLKPSELAPASAELVVSILSDLFPREYVAAMTGGPDTAAELSRLPLDHLLFTGSTRVGKLVMQAASEHLVPVTLELGGKSPAIVHADYPIEKAAGRILAGKLYSAGQTCVAPDYLLVPHGRREAFVEAARRIIARMYPSFVGNGDYTRIINADHYRRLSGLVADARGLGADVIEMGTAGERYDATNRVFPPTLVTNVREDMAIMHEEIFGPVLPIVEYRSLDDAMAYVNARPHPLALYYFDDNRKRVDTVLERTTAGGVTVNDCLFHVGQTSLPFGGIGASGMGCYHGVDGFHTFSQKKGVFVQRRWSPLSVLRPPYGARTRQILRFLLR